MCGHFLACLGRLACSLHCREEMRALAFHQCRPGSVPCCVSVQVEFCFGFVGGFPWVCDFFPSVFCLFVFFNSNSNKIEKDPHENQMILM